ncbi:MAG: hypothetical protein P8049_12055, partial [Gemmatimonadota bacterium]
MRESRRTFISVVGLYAAGSWLVLQVVDVLNQNLGLPPWAFSLALTLLLIGLPIISATAWLQSRAGREFPGERERKSVRTGGATKLFTWRNAALGGLGALALWGVVSTVWLLRTREGAGDENAADPPAAAREGPTGFLVVRSDPEEAAIRIRAVEFEGESSHGEPVRELRSLSNPIELAAGEYVLELSRADW